VQNLAAQHHTFCGQKMESIIWYLCHQRRILPSLTSWNFVRSWKIVDFPLPECPTNAAISPGLTTNETSFDTGDEVNLSLVKTMFVLYIYQVRKFLISVSRFSCFCYCIFMFKKVSFMRSNSHALCSEAYNYWDIAILDKGSFFFFCDSINPTKT
jgi:hypothetical protein